MHIKNRINRLTPTRNNRILIGYLLVAFGAFGKLMDLIDFFAILKIVGDYLPIIWQFLTSGVGTLVVIIVGLAVIGYGATRPKNTKTSGKYHDIEAEKLGEELRKMMYADNVKVDQCVLVRPTRVDLAHVRDIGGPYLVFAFWIFNASVHSIKFDKQPTGHLVYENQELKDSLEFLPGGLKPTIERTQSEVIELRQFLLPEITDKIKGILLDDALRHTLASAVSKNAKSTRISFSFNLVNLPIETITPNGNIGNIWKCPFPKEVSFELPTDGSVAYPC